MTSSSSSFEASGARPVRRCVHGHTLAVADDQRGVRPPGLGGEELLQPRLGLLQHGARLLADPQPLHEVEDAGAGAHVSASSCLCPQSAMSSCVISSTSPAFARCPRTRTCAPSGRPSAPPGPGSGAVRLGHQVHRLALLSQPCHWSGPGASFRCPAGP